ncbi:unnamed protein product [Chrysodeixis includens]|uniref:MADF domain-containing protein n=1 Tax=Chrysodeixis includens TaxID=689277 RepID=A0A9P0BSD6_CHRIL|nr:unnamed protein product [Chrysodeixis includens]
MRGASTNHSARSPAVCRSRPAQARSTPRPPHGTYVPHTMTHFTENEMQKLVEVYKDFDCLWDIRHKHYKSKEVRQNAYKQMLRRLNIPGLTVKDIPKKIKNFRSSYYQELKRIRNSINASDGRKVYQPKVSWFGLADEYLSSIWSDRHSKYCRSNDELFKLLARGPNNRKRNKLRSNADGSEAAENPATEQVEVAQTSQPSTSSSNKGADDDLDSFGKYITAALRNMPREFSIIAKRELQNTLSDIELRIMRQSTAAQDNEANRVFDPLDGASTSSSDHYSFRCETPRSDSSLSGLKIEFD